MISDDFMAEIASFANEKEMTEFPTVFYTPGVEPTPKAASPRARDELGNGSPDASGTSPEGRSSPRSTNSPNIPGWSLN